MRIKISLLIKIKSVILFLIHITFTMACELWILHERKYICIFINREVNKDNLIPNSGVIDCKISLRNLNSRFNVNLLV